MLVSDSGEPCVRQSNSWQLHWNRGLCKHSPFCMSHTRRVASRDLIGRLCRTRVQRMVTLGVYMHQVVKEALATLRRGLNRSGLKVDGRRREEGRKKGWLRERWIETERVGKKGSGENTPLHAIWRQPKSPTRR
ncbi:hypothetical protein K443DRAFT_521777 [Laccaria amethystina LaAM-08-1]|uniref:Uncharacterized protein n=1 Tax=Laccaria amethystina LaAM-08-1 TaxID=1095629 RepID=A0A0C9XXS0_9AGAR|nr:hypothetical protein K443DRAFT_521777 [Laccaria amethystina LaAM-08-1]